MTYVYILQSLPTPERYYVGMTHDLRARLQKHNAGEVSHTSKFTPWTVKTYIACRKRQNDHSVLPAHHGSNTWS